MRRILAVGSAALLAFTVTTTPLSAADLGMPMKAAPITEAPPPGVDWLPLALALLFATGVGFCIAFCEEEHHQGPTGPTSGAGNVQTLGAT